jgi:hypothetical protein
MLLMAAGYGLIGFALLTGSDGISAGRHLLTVGAIGVSIYMVLNIAGRMHCGCELDERPWVPAGAAALFVAAVIRAATVLPSAPASLLLALSSLLWIGVFAVWARHPLDHRRGHCRAGAGCFPGHARALADGHVHDLRHARAAQSDHGARAFRLLAVGLGGDLPRASG